MKEPREWWYTATKENGKTFHRLTEENCKKLMKELSDNFEAFNKEFNLTESQRQEWIKRLKKYPKMRV